MKLLDEEKMKRYQLEQLKANNETALSDMEMKLQVKEMSLSRLEVEYRNERYLDSIGSGTTDKVRQAQLAFETEKLELLQLQKQYENAQKVKEYFEEEGKLKNQQAIIPHTIDEDYWKTFLDFPKCSGVAMGVDRLIMLLADKKSIESVLPFPFRLKAGYY